MRIFQRLIILSCLLPALSYAGWFSDKNAGWHIDTNHSQLSFSSLKSQSIFENHQFSVFFGQLTVAGDLTVTIDLNSSETGIAIRNERLASMLFETNTYPQAIFSAQLPESALPKHLKKQQSKTLEINGQLSLHGNQQPVTLKVKVVRINKKRIAVSTVEPVAINVAQFALSDGVEALREIAGLPSISLIVPVTFAVELEQE